MKILVVGGGGREHAIVTKISQSPKVTKIFAAPGNAGMRPLAECVSVKACDVEGMVAFAKQNKIDLVMVAPDDPLMLGMVDAMQKAGIRAFGPVADAAVIEGSKVFSKGLMKKYGVPTAAYETFDSPQAAIAYIKNQNKYPAVIKADGLALGKGVVIAQSEQEAVQAVNSMMSDKVFGEAGARVVVEEFLTGPEVSVLAFTDGKTLCPMVSAQDHKRVFDGDKGPNTGGMGAFSPSRHYTPEMAKRCMEEIFLPTVNAMKAEGRKFKGVLYFGLMLTADGPRVIEYNARFGDPETQVVLPRLKTDLVDIFEAVIDERLGEIEIEWDNGAALCVVMSSGGYPGKYETGLPISGLDNASKIQGITVYHAGTRLEGDFYVTSGGRVLAATALGENLEDAADKAYKAVEAISFHGAHYRRDIGKN